MIEWCGFDPLVGPRGIYDGHVAFDYASVSYTAAVTSCSSDPDCEDQISDNGCELGEEPEDDQVRCKGGRCVTTHGSQVASVISATKPGNPSVPSGAAKAKLMVANHAKPDTDVGYESLYEELRLAGVRTVNETHGGINFYGGPQVADWYARTFGMLPVQSAGNSATGAGVACNKSANAICVGATTDQSTFQVAGYSNALNPSSSDREEPDVMAFGGDKGAAAIGDSVQVLRFADTKDWSGSNAGTSFAAPSVTSMVAHFRKACEPYYGTNIGHQFLRAVVRTSAWAGNPDGGQRYSTPSPPFTDWLDGAGWVDAPALDFWCHAGIQGTGGTRTIDLFRGTDPDPGTVTSYDPGGPAPQSQPLDYTPPHDTAAYPRKEYELAAMFLDVGDRIRFTISWDVCATGALDTPSAGVGIDLDLFLYNSTTKDYVYGSQSVADNNEGFDVTIGPDQERGVYKVFISRPAGDNFDCGSFSETVVGYAGRWGQW